MSTVPYYSQSELANRAGLTRFAVNAAIRRGLIVTVTTIDGDGVLIPKAEGDRWLSLRKTTRGPEKTPAPDAMSVKTAKRRRA